jgi:hypothetical protein
MLAEAFFYDIQGFSQLRQTINPERMGLRGSQAYALGIMAEVYSHPAVGRRHLRHPRANFATLNTYLSRDPTAFATWI